MKTIFILVLLILNAISLNIVLPSAAESKNFDKKAGTSDSVYLKTTMIDFYILAPFSIIVAGDNLMMSKKKYPLNAYNATVIGVCKISPKLKVGILGGYHTPWTYSADDEDETVQERELVALPLLGVLSTAPTRTIDIMVGVGLYRINMVVDDYYPSANRYGGFYGINMNIPVAQTVYIPIFFHFHFVNILGQEGGNEKLWVFLQFGTGVKLGFE